MSPTATRPTPRQADTGRTASTPRSTSPLRASSAAFTRARAGPRLRPASSPCRASPATGRGSSRSAANASDVGPPVHSGTMRGRSRRARVRSRICPTPTCRSRRRSTTRRRAFGTAGVLAGRPVADRHFRVRSEMCALDGAGHRRNPAEQVGSVPLPDRVQDASARATVGVDGGHRCPDDRVRHLDEGRRDLARDVIAHSGPPSAPGSRQSRGHGHHP